MENTNAGNEKVKDWDTKDKEVRSKVSLQNDLDYNLYIEMTCELFLSRARAQDNCYVRFSFYSVLKRVAPCSVYHFNLIKTREVRSLSSVGLGSVGRITLDGDLLLDVLVCLPSVQYIFYVL